MTDNEKIVFHAMRPGRLWSAKDLSNRTGLDGKATRNAIRALIFAGLVSIKTYDRFGRFNLVETRQLELTV